MIWRLLTIGFWAMLAVGAAEQQNSSYRNATLTGCIDEQPGPQYVLRGLSQLKLIANLEPDGFAVQSFAKYLGKKVRVKGRLSSGNEPAVMRVRIIKALPGPCAPAGANAPGATGKSETKTLRGCIDEQPGSKYVLLSAETREVRARLEPAGFPVQNLARFVGHSVSIRGDALSDQSPPLLRIKQFGDIHELADHCAPQ